MNKKTLALTLGAAVVVSGVGVMMSNSNQPSAEFETAKVLPALAEQAGQLTRIKVEVAGNTLVVESHLADGKWLIDNLGNYTADTQKLSELINSLKDAKKVESKTAKPKLFHHLGVRDITNPESNATQVTLEVAGKSYQVLVGDSAKNGAGQYVRLAGDNQTWLIDQAIDKPENAQDWVDNKLFDFAIEAVKSVNLSGKFSYGLSKADKEQTNFALDNMPDTHQLKYDSIADGVPQALASLTFDDLVKLTDLPAFSDTQTLSVTLFDNNSTIDVVIGKHQTAVAGDEKGEDAGELANESEAAPEVESKYYAKLTGNNPLWQQWAYEISEYNYNQLAKDKTDLLDEKADEKVDELQLEAVQPASDSVGSDTP